MRFREFRAFLIQRGGMLARNFRNARTAEPPLDANSFASLGIGLSSRLCRDNTPRFDVERGRNCRTRRRCSDPDRATVDKSPYHSLTPKKANKWRIFVITPDCNNHWESEIDYFRCFGLFAAAEILADILREVEFNFLS
jgi:hypothetical protein